jgi:dipeptide/tripeptide permease
VAGKKGQLKRWLAPLPYNQEDLLPMDTEEKQKNYELAERLISEQNFAAATIAGAIATLLAAVAYGIIVESWPFSYGFAAAGVGTVVGFFMGFLGRGISIKFSVMAALYAIAGCVLGNLFVKIMSLAQATATSPSDVLRSNSLSVFAQWAVAGLLLIQLVFWFVAVVAAGFLAKRPLSRAQRLAIGMYELNQRAA